MATIIGGTGNDKKPGTTIADDIFGDAGNDTLLGIAGDDTLTGGEGNDSLDGGAGADSMEGGSGNDTYVVDNAEDTVVEEADAGTDNVKASVSYTLTDNVEDLTLTGKSAINGTGNELNNVLTGNSGINILTGGEGDDTYIVQSASDTVVEEDGEGTDSVRTVVSYTLSDHIEELVLLGRSKAEIKKAKIINGTGNDTGNTLIGNTENNILDGKGGADTMTGVQGNDTYFIDNEDDLAEEAAGQGTDTVKSTINYTLGDNLENLVLLGDDSLAGTGNALKNVITGNAGMNTLDGGAGADTLKGLGGDDIYYVDNTKDLIVEGKNAGTDVVVSSLASYTLGDNLENAALSESETARNLVGNDVANVLTGNDENNNLNGGKGADTMVGGDGDDIYVVDNSGDVVTESDDEGTDTVEASISYTLGDFLENLTLTGKGNINGMGNAANNVIRGNAGNNVLDGREGQDTLIGGDGNDTYIVDELDDVVTETSSKGGTDTVQTTISYTLGTNIENLTLTSEIGSSATGNNLANILTGNSGGNRLDGGAGNDTLRGGLGADTYVFSGNFGKDVISDSDTNGTLDLSGVTTNGSVSLTAKKDQAIYGKNTINWNTNTIETVKVSSIIDVIGGSGNDKITGDARGNALSGGDGNDTLVGGAGNDTLSAGGGSNTLTGGADHDTYVLDDDTVFARIEEEVTGQTDSTRNDTIDASLVTQDLIIDLDAGTVSTVVSSSDEFLITEGANDPTVPMWITRLADGSMVATWNDDFQYGLVQHLSSDGQPQGEVFNGTSTSELTYPPTVAALSDGGYVITWVSNQQVYAQRFTSEDETVGDVLTVMTDETGGAYTAPKAIGLSNGGFAIVFMYSEGQEFNEEVYARVYDDDGEPLGSAFQVNTYSDNSQSSPSVTALENGFAVVWHSADQDESGYGIYGKIYGNDGQVLNSEFQISTTTLDNQWEPTVSALANGGGFVVVWQSPDDDDTGIFGQRFEADGTPVGAEFQINTHTASSQEYAQVVGLSDGGFAVVWRSNEQDGQDYGIFGQVFDDEGNRSGTEFQVNTTTFGDQNGSHLVALDNGQFLVTWIDDNRNEIYARIFDNTGHAVESGTTAGTTIATVATGTIEHAYGGSGDDEITGNSAANLLIGNDGDDTLDGGSGNDTLQGGSGYDKYTGFNFVQGGSDTINDVSNKDILDTDGSGLLDLGNLNLNEDVSFWQALDGDDDDAFVEDLCIHFNNGASITIHNYFDNSVSTAVGSEAGSGYLDIQFADDDSVDFAQVVSILSV